MRTTFLIASDLQAALNAAIVRDNYSNNRKSRWINEAILDLPERDPSLTTVGLGEGNEVFDCVMGLSLTPAAQRLIAQIKTRIRRYDPEAEGLNSQIIRAAIRTRVKNA